MNIASDHVETMTAPSDNPPPFTLPASEACTRLGVDPERGLSATEAAARLSRLGPNALAERAVTPRFKLLLRQLANPLLVVLLAGGAVSVAIGHWIDAAAILPIVCINAGIGFIQEASAEASLAALRAMARFAGCDVGARDHRRMKRDAQFEII